ncbi:hypothetical protein GCM10009655_17890 [Rhodoglobus aureus]|uniref:Recombinase A n=2 Tax=Rhodoglobus aureus TaxID=191497 RepID=A0ABN1VQU9_9MICO
MSQAIDTLEHMFEHEQVSPVSAQAFSANAEALSSEPSGGATPVRAAPERVAELQSRISQMQSRTLNTKLIPTHPAIGQLLPGGGLQQGSVYSIDKSTMLLMALLAPPSAAGSWCAVIGVPEFGIEAAARFGVDLERLVLVPHPGDQWLAVTAAIADVIDVVVARPPTRASDSAVARLASRLRQRKSTLLMMGSWPQSEAMVSLGESRWHGIGAGYGHLAAREVTVTVTSKSAARPRSARLWLPDSSETVRAYNDHEGAKSGLTALPELTVLPELAVLPHRVSA